MTEVAPEPAQQRPRGRVLASAYLRLPSLETQPAVAGRRALDLRQVAAATLVALVLPLFAQTFQYVVDLPPLYALSKAWPLLMLPLAVAGALLLPMEGRALFLVSFAWLYGVTPAVSILELGNSPLGALATTVKVWSLTYVFSLVALLFWISPGARTVSRTIVALGVLTYAVLLLLWWTVPLSAYSQSMMETKLFLWDMDRGKRIYAPMFFGMMLIFILNRSMWLRPRAWKVLAIGFCFLVLLTMYKQRTAIAAGAMTVLIGAILSLPRGRLLSLVLLSAGGLFVLLPGIGYLLDHELGASLGGSLSTRQSQLSVAVDFLGAEPWRWIVGVGSITRVGGLTFAEVLGADYFFLADLGWLGVIFEYGVVGAGLLLLLHLVGLAVTARAAQAPDPVARALLDYVVYILLSSAVYSVVFAPGELATCIALALYLNRTDGRPAPQ